jgi:2-oxoglutarate dehydrogenase E1 component
MPNLSGVRKSQKNMGSWTFIRDFIEEVMDEINMAQSRLLYAGRPAAASPATGTLARHNREQKALVDEALGLLPSKPAGKTKNTASAKK